MFVPEEGIKVLSDEQVATIHETAMRICEEIGLDVMHDDARKLLSDAGLKVQDDRLLFGKGFPREQVAKAPARFTLQARDPAKTHEVGGPTPLWMNVGGPPFASDLEGGRRSGTLADHDALVKLTHAAKVLNCVQTGAVEAMELDVHTRHMDMEYSTIRWSDEPYATYGTNGPKARDGIEMAAIVHGGREAIERDPALIGIVNSNSPLVWDFKMVEPQTPSGRAAGHGRTRGRRARRPGPARPAAPRRGGPGASPAPRSPSSGGRGPPACPGPSSRRSPGSPR